MSVPRILVIGEAMTDRYYLGSTSRVSPEAPIPVVKVLTQQDLPGGAANVAENLRALGAEVREMYPVGPQPRKNRLMVGNVQVARWDEQDRCEAFQWQRDFASINYDSYAAIVISDYGKGAFTPEIRKGLGAALRNHRVYVDCKCGPLPWEPYPLRGLATWTWFPNLKEFYEHEEAYRGCPTVVLTEGSEGMRVLRYGQTIEHHHALAKQVVSVCGAGDTVLAAFAYGGCLGYTLGGALTFASVAAASVVEKPLTAVPDGVA